jgi:hypothetical protein
VRVTLAHRGVHYKARGEEKKERKKKKKKKIKKKEKLKKGFLLFRT